MIMSGFIALPLQSDALHSTGSIFLVYKWNVSDGYNVY